MSTRLAIMTKGGKLACQGTSQQIKSDHGMNFNINLTISLDFLEEEIEIVENNNAEEKKRAGSARERGRLPRIVGGGRV